MKTNIKQWGNSQAIRLPKAILETANFEKNQEVTITARDNQIIIEKSVSKGFPTLKELLEGYEGSYIGEEWNTGEPVGSELL